MKNLLSAGNLSMRDLLSAGIETMNELLSTGRDVFCEGNESTMVCEVR
jgi:hypothetical protein